MAGSAADFDADFDAAYAPLKGLLEPYARAMYVSADDGTTFGVDMAPAAERNPTTWFGGVRRGKRYVSIYLMPVYVEPSLLEGASPKLLRRKQGKSRFNFSRVDDGLFAELGAILRIGYEQTAGDPTWGAAKRVEHGMAHRRAGASGVVRVVACCRSRRRARTRGQSATTTREAGFFRGRHSTAAACASTTSDSSTIIATASSSDIRRPRAMNVACSSSVKPSLAAPTGSRSSSIRCSEAGGRTP